MAGITDINAALAAEKEDLITLTGLVTQLLAAFAAGTLTPGGAQDLLNEITDEDTTVKSNIASITAALPPAPVTAPTA